MSLRTRLGILITGSVVAASALGSSVLLIVMYRQEVQSLRSRLLAAATGAARVIDVRTHERLRRQWQRQGSERIVRDPDTAQRMPGYTSLHTVLGHVKAISSATAVYTLVRDPEDADYARFLVQSYSRPNLGERLPVTPDLRRAFAGETVTTGIYADAHGHWMSALAPLRDDRGRVVGVLEADFSAMAVTDQLRAVERPALGVALLLMLLAAAASLLAARQGIRPLTRLDALMHSLPEQAAAGRLACNWSPTGVKEVDELAHTFCNLSSDLLVTQKQLQDRAAQLERLNRELQLAYDELQLAQQKMAQSEKLRALGEMASGIAHDFNNALSGILGNAQLLQMKLEPGPLRDKVETILQCSDDATAIVKRLQDFARNRAPSAELEPVALTRLVEDVIEMTKPRWDYGARKRGIHIEVAAELDESVTACGNASELREALTNLIFNAVDAMDADGRITIRARAAGEHVLLEVEDTGAGIPDQVLPRIFEPFFTTKGEQGNGMGLSGVYGIVQHHGGEIDVHTEQGRGTRFTISLLSYCPQNATSHSTAA